MILNTYAVLDLSLAGLRLIVGVLIVALAIAGLGNWRRVVSSEVGQAAEDRSYLLFLLAWLLLTLNLVSWPVLYLLLQSYVPESPGTMCIYGVTKIGMNSAGISRFLPALVEILQVTKPLLVFVGGAWFILYIMNRRTRTAPLTKRILILLVVLGLMAAAESAVEAAYLTIPKKEVIVSDGCCTGAFVSGRMAGRFLPAARISVENGPGLSLVYYFVNLGMMAGLTVCCFSSSVSLMRWLKLLLLGAALSIPVWFLFLVQIAAPVLLNLPYHHCPYDLIHAVPEMVVGITMFLLGSFATGWAGITGWLANCAETGSFLQHEVRRLLSFSLFGYVVSVGMLTTELLLART